jgi:hypothetical protein
MITNPFAPPAPPAFTPPSPFAARPVGMPVELAAPYGAPQAPTQPLPEADKSDADLTGEYIALRDEKKVIASRHQDELAPINDRMARIEAVMLARLDRQEVQSVKTTKGTAFKKTQTSYSVGDPEVLFPWIEANGRSDMLARSIRPDAMREYAEEHKALPPGVEVFSRTVVQFRK